MAKRRTSESKVEQVAVGLAGGLTPAGAAREYKVPDSTIRGWLTDPAFRSRVDRHRTGMVTHAIGILSRLASHAAVTLGDLLTSSHVDDVRLRAAREVLNQLLNVKSHAELVDRMESLERHHAASR